MTAAKNIKCIELFNLDTIKRSTIYGKILDPGAISSAKASFT